MSYWWAAIRAYGPAAAITLAPTLTALFGRVKPNPGGISFEGTSALSQEAKAKLSDAIFDKPVMFHPGRARLSTSLSPTGSGPKEKTIGTVVVARWAANAAG